MNYPLSGVISYLTAHPRACVKTRASLADSPGMSSTPRLRVVGLAAGLAVLALAAGYFLLSGGQQSSTAASTHTVIPLSKRSHAKAKKRTAVRRHAAVPKPAPAPKPVTKAPAAATDGLPAAISDALAQNRVVVVSLYAPKIDLDLMATREAEAGARTAGAGFVALNVLSEEESRPLTKQLGVLEDPAVLVYRRPGELVVRFTGFADQQTVAQAARNAGL